MSDKSADTFLRLLQGCNSMNRLLKIHAQVITNGHHDNSSISSKLLSFCATSKAGNLPYAHLLFSSLPNPQTQHFNSLIRASSLSPSPIHSLSFYNQMMTSHPHSRPDPVTFSFLLKAIQRSKTHSKCLEAHGSIIRFGFSSNVIVCTNLVQCYVDNGLVGDARKVFDEMLTKDLVAWNSMISCYHKVGMHKEALEVYEEMRIENVGMDEFTAVALLASCANLGALSFGGWVHRFAEDSGFLERNVIVGNALIEMYAKCGCLDGARRVFDGMWRRDVYTWNSMIIGLGIHGCGEEAILCFERMVMAGVRPNSITFLGLLMGCTHQGLVDVGIKYFRLMSSDFGLKPDLKHYGCMVDLFGRAGKIDNAFDMIRSSNCEDDPVLWRTLLNACKIYKNVEIGEVAMKNLVQLSAHNAGDCALLAEIYAHKGDRKGAARMRKMVKNERIKTTPGWSWIEVKGKIEKFFVGDVSHPDIKKIHNKLEEMIAMAVLMGYAHEKSKINFVNDEFNREQQTDLEEEMQFNPVGGPGAYHSEMLAIAYGLMEIQEQKSILRVVKNLRVCNNCHSLTKFFSLAFEQEIVVRDRVRFHHFKDGSCSCNDYW